jgi:hypothetical protein
MAPKSKSTAKPSLHTRFVLDAMAQDAKREEERWGKMQESIDLLYAKVDEQGDTQQQMTAQLQLTT